MSAALKAALFADNTTHATVRLHTEATAPAPYLFVDILCGDDITASLQIWSYEPAVFRRLAAAFEEAGATLAAAQAERESAVTT